MKRFVVRDYSTLERVEVREISERNQSRVLLKMALNAL
jgi:hypothetical protein